MCTVKCAVATVPCTKIMKHVKIVKKHVVSFHPVIYIFRGFLGVIAQKQMSFVLVFFLGMNVYEKNEKT